MKLIKLNLCLRNKKSKRTNSLSSKNKSYKNLAIEFYDEGCGSEIKMIDFSKKFVKSKFWLLILILVLFSFLLNYTINRITYNF